MASRAKKIVELSAYELNYDKPNLFEDDYGTFLRPDECIYNEINDLKSRNYTDSLKLGRNLLELLDGNITCAGVDKLLAHPAIQIGRTQAIKYIESYNYVNAKYQNKQSTENLEELGIEKVYLLTTVKDSRKQEKLEKFIVEHTLTVKQITQLIKILNEESKEFRLATIFLNEFEEEYCFDTKDPLNPF